MYTCATIIIPTSLTHTQLEDGHSLFDYDVGLNDIIQLMIRPHPVPTHSKQPLPDSTHSPHPTTNGDMASHNNMDTVS